MIFYYPCKNRFYAKCFIQADKLYHSTQITSKVRNGFNVDMFITLPDILLTQVYFTTEPKYFLYSIRRKDLLYFLRLFVGLDNNMIVVWYGTI